MNHLRELCQQIQSSLLSNPVKPIYYVLLEFPLTLNHVQRLYKVGRFFGRGGQCIRFLEHIFNVRINILNNKSSKEFRQIVDELQVQNKENHTNDLLLLITMKNNNNDMDYIEKVKQTLQDEWKKDKCNMKERLEKIRFHE